jgi:hypothetical protein
MLPTRPGGSESRSGSSATAALERTVIFSFQDDHNMSRCHVKEHAWSTEPLTATRAEMRLNADFPQPIMASLLRILRMA